MWIGPARRHAAKGAGGGPRLLFGRLGHAIVLAAVATYGGEVPLMARTTQRDVMRELIRHFDGDHDKVVAGYAAAEPHRTRVVRETEWGGDPSLERPRQ